jgi:hypothetical protein
MKVQDLAAIIRRLEAQDLSPAEREALSAFLTGLVPLEDMDLTAFFGLLKPRAKRNRGTGSAGDTRTKTPAPKASEIAASLHDVFYDDAAFEQTLRGIADKKSITVPTLKSAFAALFRRDGNFRSKATRADVVRKILTERNIAVRDEKMGAMLGRKPVQAE